MRYQTEERTCDICGSTNFEPVWESKEDGTVTLIKNDDGQLVHNKDVLCMNCRHVFKYPSMTRESLDNFYKDDYSALFRPDWKDNISRTMLVYTLTQAVIAIDWLRSTLDLKNKQVLEIGAGDGMFMKALESEGALPVGIDSDPRAVEIAGKLHGYKLMEQDFMQPFDLPAKFDIVSMRNTLEHMYSATEAFKRATELVKDDGKIFIEVPLAGRPYPGMPVGAFLSAAHMCTFSMESFMEMVDKAGWHIESFTLEGHKGCMMCILAKGQMKHTFTKDPKEYLSFLQERYKEHNNTFFEINSFCLKLFQSSNVSNSIGEIKKHKHTSNWIAFQYLTALIGQPEGMDRVANFLDNYEWDATQGYDENCHPATLEYIKGIFFREMGDFSSAIKQFSIAKSQYPRILSYNFVKELILEGIVSESIFNNFLWFSCERFCRAMG